MGQKAHPNGLRLGIIKKHRACWFESSNSYSKRLIEDHAIRQFLYKSLQSAGITDLTISRTLGDHINISLKLTKPALFMSAGEHQLDSIRQKLTTLLFQHRQYYTLKNESETSTQPQITLYIAELAQPESCAIWVANSIVEQLEKRVAWRRAVQKTARRVARAKIPGLKVQISGRLNGAEIARREWIREGRVPLQTLCADIDYCQTTAQTIYGTLGIKVWVFRKLQTTY